MRSEFEKQEPLENENIKAGNLPNQKASDEEDVEEEKSKEEKKQETKDTVVTKKEGLAADTLVIEDSKKDSLNAKAISDKFKEQKKEEKKEEVKKEIVVEQTTWNRRFREYMEKIKTGSIFEICEVVRDLCVIRQDKVLSFGEKKMLELAKGLMVKELSIAEGSDEPSVEAQVEEIFAKPSR
jgi:CarD family transcriptional regulator